VAPVDATALASNVLPVPGGPKSRTPFQALLFPTKIWGNASGNKTAYSRISLALVSSAISSKVILVLISTTYLYSDSIRLESGPLPSGYTLFKNVFLSSSFDPLSFF